MKRQYSLGIKLYTIAFHFSLQKPTRQQQNSKVVYLATHLISVSSYGSREKLYIKLDEQAYLCAHFDSD